jgi:hypothetical protein
LQSSVGDGVGTFSGNLLCVVKDGSNVSFAGNGVGSFSGIVGVGVHGGGEGPLHIGIWGYPLRSVIFVIIYGSFHQILSKLFPAL